MIVISCQHRRYKRNGKDSKGRQRYKCLDCGLRFKDTEPNLLDGMTIDLDRAEMILGMLVEGTSVRSIALLTNTDPHTVIKLMNVVGKRC